MIRTGFASRSSLMLAGCLVLALVAMPADGQDTPADAAQTAKENVGASVATDQQSQQKKDAWEKERSGLQARYRQLKVDVEYLEERVDREQAGVEALEAKVAEFERRLVEAERLNDSLEDTLAVMTSQLAEAVGNDLPFQGAEREGRLNMIRRELADPDTPPAEKLRRVLEAYQIEAQYGGTVEIAADRITVDGNEISADILRIGRLVLFWRTPDGSRYGTWDPGDGAWKDLPRNQHRAISQAMDMAARMRPVAVVGLPLGRIER